MSEDNVQEIVRTIAQLKAVQRETQGEIDLLQSMLIDILAETNDEYEDDVYRAQIVRSSTSAWDQDALQDIIPKTMWPRVTVRVVSDDLLSAAVQRGSINAHDLEDALVVKQRKPYVKITTKLQAD